MTAPGGSSRPFLGLIRELDGEIDLPTPDRLRILRELESDLESMRDRLCAEGMDDHEATRRAIDILVPDAVTLQRLGQLHEPRWHRLTRNLGDQRLRLLERSLLAICAGGVTLASVMMLSRAALLSAPSPFMLPMLGLGGLMVAAILRTAFRTWVRFDQVPESSGTSLVLGLAGAALALAVVGTVVDAYSTAALLELNASNDIVVATRWLVRDAALIAVALVIAMAGGLTWFITSQWLTLIQGERLAFLDLEARLPILKEF